MKLSGNTKVHDLLVAHPYLEGLLASYNPKFEMLKNRMARATIGRVATLRTAAGIASLDLDAFLLALATEIERQSGSRPDVAGATDGEALTRPQRLQALKEIIGTLHDGGDLDAARERFAQAVQDVEASEIAAMEEELIRGGLPVSEVQRLCDVHVGAFKPALDEHAQVEAPAGHPVHTYVADNQTISRLATELGGLVRRLGTAPGDEAIMTSARAVLDELGGLENHYRRKENQLFPVLERHGITGPSQVMWGVHDQIRAAMKAVRSAIEQRDTMGFAAKAPAFARDVVEMIYKEEKILFPLALQTLSDSEWAEVRRGEDELGYVFAKPADRPQAGAASGPQSATVAHGLLGLMTGEISLEQVNLLFTHLPVDLSFVDETDTVRFYSEGPHRVFPRTPAAIGRKVQHCHPPKSVHIVQEILDSFRAGTQSVAEFWIEMQGRLLHIRYIAIRDQAGAYRGCLEVTQDVTAIRALNGQRRLLEWTASPEAKVA